MGAVGLISVYFVFYFFCFFYRVPVLRSEQASIDTVNANRQQESTTINRVAEIWQGWSGSPESVSFSACKEILDGSCTLEIKEEDAEKFRSLIFDEEALAIFMYVTVGNYSLDPDELEVAKYFQKSAQGGGKIIPHGIQMKEKLAWIRNKRGKFLATLPYDFDILSLTTLTRDVFDLSVQVNSTPTNCFTNLTKGCIFHRVAGLLAQLVEFKHGNICIKAFSDTVMTRAVSYYCCKKEKNSGHILCNVPVKSNRWIRFAIYLLWALASVFGLFSPLLFKYFPKEFKKGSKSKLRQRGIKRSMSSSASLIDSFSLNLPPQRILFEKNDTILDILRTSTKSILCARISRCLFIILLSCFPVLQAFLYVYLKEEEVGINQKDIGVGDAYLTLIGPTEQYTVSALYCFCVLLLCIAVAIPHSLSDLARRLAGRRDERNFLGFQKPEELVNSSTDQRGFQLLYENMVFHLNSALTFKYWKFVFEVCIYPLKMVCCSSPQLDDSEPEQQVENASETHPLLVKQSTKSGKCSYICNIVVVIIFFPIWVVLIQTAFILHLIPVTYVAFRIWRMLFRLEVNSKSTCCEFVPVIVKLISLPLLYVLFMVFCCCVEVAYLLLIAILSVNIVFLGSIIGFTITGLIFYIDFFLPYIIVCFLGLVYILQGIHNYHSQYVHLKNAIFEVCEKQDSEVRGEVIRGSFTGQISPPLSSVSDRKISSSSQSTQKGMKTFGLVFADEDGVLSIPFDFFLQACNKFLPFKRIVLAKILKLLAIAGYLMAVFAFVMSLVEFEAASPLVQSIAILLLGAIPLRYSRKFSISETEQKRMNSHLQDMVKRYQKKFSP